ncbi:TPA: tail protein X [Salmonella enterica subsp. enterica serovar Potsdam]
MDTLWLEHITADGERWDQIAYRYYGDPLGYARIILANPHVAVTPVLRAGQRLAIPVIDADQTTQELPPWLQ